MELRLPIKVVLRGTCEIIRKAEREAMEQRLAEYRQPGCGVNGEHCAECAAIIKRLKG